MIFEKRKLSSILFKRDRTKVKRDRTKEASGAVLTKRKTGNSFSVTGLLCFMIFEKENCRASFLKRPEQRKLSSILFKREKTKEASCAALTDVKVGGERSECTCPGCV